MKMDDQRQKAFDFCSELTKQLLTLSTGIIAITVTFSKDVFGSMAATSNSWMIGSWVSYVASILFGVWTLMALTGTLEPAPDQQVDASIRGANVRIPSLFQILLFLTGISCTVVYAVKATIVSEEQSVKQEYKVPSATHAIEAVKRQLPLSPAVKINKIELIQGIETHSSKYPVWHVQVDINTPTSSDTSPAKRTKQKVAKAAKKYLITVKSLTTPADFFVDAKTGQLVSIGLTSP